MGIHSKICQKHPMPPRPYLFACCLVLTAAVSGARAQVTVLDVRAVPYLDNAGRVAYARWLLSNLPRAFAVAPGGAYGVSVGSDRDADPARDAPAREAALQDCRAKAVPGCAVYAEGLNITWPSREARAPAPPGPLLRTWSYALVPDARYIWHGPQAARGVMVWAHGNNGPEVDGRGAQPYQLIRPLNNAGYDVVRFDRQPMADDRDVAAGWMRDSLRELRRLGYRSVVVGGESRGAWNGLQMLDTPGLADAVVAISAAAHGTGGSTGLSAQYDDLRAILAAALASRTRVAFVQFQADPYIGSADRRIELLRRAAPRLGALLLIDRPAGLSGHTAGATSDFADRYGGCLARFIMDQAPSSSCPGQVP